MTNVERGIAIQLLDYYGEKLGCKTEFDLTIKALERDAKVDYITKHWNDVRHNFVAACEAFEEILKVYGRGISEDVENEDRN